MKVIDDIEPVLVLNKTNLTLEYGQNIDLKDYIEKAEDNIDGNLVEKVDYNQIDTSKPGNHVVTYSVKDKAGNHVSAEMSINIKESQKLLKNLQTVIQKIMLLLINLIIQIIQSQDRKIFLHNLINFFQVIV